MFAEFKGKPGDYYSDELVMGAEPHLDFNQRIESALSFVVSDAKEKGYQTVIVVTHGNVTRSIYQHILNFSRSDRLGSFG